MASDPVPGPARDLLTGWQCRRGEDGPWLDAEVPGTVAGALRAAGLPAEGLDDVDWSYRARVADDPGPGPWTLHAEGLATLAEVSLDGTVLLRSDSMFRAHRVELDTVTPGAELLVRFAALTPVLAQRRRGSRPRWKVARLVSQNLRWVRTSLLGRLIGWVPTPPPVGPWRPLTLTATRPTDIVERRLRTTVDDDGPGGAVHVELTLQGEVATAELHVAGTRAPLTINGRHVSGSVRLPVVERWWPHSHGAQPMYEVDVVLDGVTVGLGRVGFRSVTVDRSDGGFALSVNGVPVRCRGTVWTPPDPVGLVTPEAELRAAVQQVRDGNLTMIRVPGETVYPDAALLDLLDELGILLWQDAMFAFVDVPDDPALLGSIDAELEAMLTLVAAHPCLAVVSGGSEIEQQAAMVGTPRDQRAMPLFEHRLPELVSRLAPGTPCITASPTGGELAIQPRTGVAHYYGVGAYLRHPDDARRSGTRFAAECLAFATPPEPQTVDEACGGAARAGHHPGWKAAVHRDAGAAWDFEDVRDHYVRTLFGVEPTTVRPHDPERALELGRAVVAELFQRTWSEWQRPASPCAGAIVFHHRDLAPGAGLGVVDAFGRPKAPWYVMRRVLAPLTVVLTDEGLNGLDAHVVNDTGRDRALVLQVELLAHGETVVETVDRPLHLPAHARLSVDLTGLFDGFRDLSWAHRFGPPTPDVVVTLLEAGHEVARAVHLIGDAPRPREVDLGLHAEAAAAPDGSWTVALTTRRLAQWVALDVPGWRPDDGWFHLPPGHRAEVRLVAEPATPASRPRGAVRALNALHPVRLTLPAV